MFHFVQCKHCQTFFLNQSYTNKLNFDYHNFRNTLLCCVVRQIDVRTNKYYSYDELFSLVGRFALGLRERDFGPGDVYMTITPNTPEAVVALLGVMATGGIVSGINPLVTKGKLVPGWCVCNTNLMIFQLKSRIDIEIDLIHQLIVKIDIMLMCF